jgi:hypothetical protein
MPSAVSSPSAVAAAVPVPKSTTSWKPGTPPAVFV